MQDMEQAFVTELYGIAGPVYPMIAPDNSLAPFVVYTKSKIEYMKTLDGTSHTRQGWYDIDLIDKTYQGLQAKFALVKAKLLSFARQRIGVDGPFVQDVTMDNIVEFFDDGPMYYRMHFEIHFFYEEAI